MPGKVQSYETSQVRKGPKNTLLGVKPVPLLMWQMTDRKGNIHTELGVEMEPGKIRKFPADLLKQALPVNDKLQKLLFDRLHPELAEANEDGPEAAPPGRTPKTEAVARLPKDVPLLEETP